MFLNFIIFIYVYKYLVFPPTMARTGWTWITFLCDIYLPPVVVFLLLRLLIFFNSSFRCYFFHLFFHPLSVVSRSFVFCHLFFSPSCLFPPFLSPSFLSPHFLFTSFLFSLSFFLLFFFSPSFSALFLLFFSSFFRPVPLTVGVEKDRKSAVGCGIQLFKCSLNSRRIHLATFPKNLGKNSRKKSVNVP